MGTVLAVLSGFVLAPFAPVVVARARRPGPWLAALPLLLTAYFAFLVPRVHAEGAWVAGIDWVPSLGVRLTFLVDGFGVLFALLVTGIGALVALYAGSYLRGHGGLGRFQAYLLAFMASMLGLVLADNLLALFVFWELTSVASYLLIGFEHERAEARRAAWQSLIVTFAGGQALLAGLLLLAAAAGTMELSVLFDRGAAVRESPLHGPAIVLILLGAFVKSAQVPFHFWLPNAMAAPAPVSAYLHSATMVKAGVYLLARMAPVLSGAPAWEMIVPVVGAATLLVGAVAALRESHLKKLLAYSTVSALGLLVLLIGIGTPAALRAMVVFLVAHAMYKGALFLAAGAVARAGGSPDARALGGLLRRMPLLAVASIAAALSMAGVPAFVGFVAKENVYEALFYDPGARLAGAAAVAGLSLLVAIALIVGVRPFLGRPAADTAARAGAAADPPAAMLVGPIALASLGIAAGLAPALLERTIAAPAVAAIVRAPVALDLVAWPGLGPIPLLGLATLAAGAVVFAAWTPIRRLLAAAHAERWGPDRWYDLADAGLNAGARRLTRLLQDGYLRHYIAITLLVLAVGVGRVTLGRGVLPAVGDWIDIRLVDAGVLLVIAGAMLVTVLSRSLLAAVAALSVVGYGEALVFVLFSAPDVAMAQVLVQTLTVLLFVLVFYRVPKVGTASSARVRVRDAIVAILAGASVTTAMLFATEVRADDGLMAFYLRESLAHGAPSNVVNAILMDFRALDTLGETVVLGVAGVGVYVLLRLRPGREEDAGR